MNSSFEELMEKAQELPKGLPRITLLEEAARVADLANDVKSGFMAREMIVDDATFNGYPLKALMAFSWMLGQFDKNEELSNSFDLLWSYKWILNQLSCFPDVPLEQIDRLLEDMRERCIKYGYSERAYYYFRSVNLGNQGRREEADQCLQQYLQMDRDELSDCIACEQNRLVSHTVFMGNDEQALKYAKPILTGRMKCAEVPHMTYSNLLMPLYRLNRIEEANKYQREGYRLIKDNRDFLEEHGKHIYYLAHTDPFRGLELLEGHYWEILHHEDPMDVMMFLAYSSALLYRLTKESMPVFVRLPDNSPHLPSDEESPNSKTGNAALLAERFRQDALAAADRFDRRNGNAYYRSLIESLWNGL